MTLDQVQARVDYLKDGRSYKVLDDLRPFLDPEVANVSMTEEYYKKLYNK